MIYFNNDYMEGALPEVMNALSETNMEHSVGYGFDEHTAEARDLIRKACGAPEALVQFLVGGTQTNATVIDALLRRHEGVLCAESAHINVHESGAIEHSGHKVLTLPTYEGKIRAADVEAYISGFYADDTYEHMVAPGMVYITQPTELGTMYSLCELEEMKAVCQRWDIPLYIDGARLAYALASPECDFTLSDIARVADVFYIGGTKCGLLFGEAVVAPRPERLPHFFPLVKQHGALLAKGRLLGVQFATLFRNGLYVEAARRAVRLALRIKEAFASHGCTVAIDSVTNQQFVTLPNALLDSLTQEVSLEIWGARGTEETTVRLVTSWATREEDADRLEAILNSAK